MIQNYRLTETQVKDGENFINNHDTSCPKMSIETRRFMEVEEQVTVVSSYAVSFIYMGICFSSYVSCTICGEKHELIMSSDELAMF